MRPHRLPVITQPCYIVPDLVLIMPSWSTMRNPEALLWSSESLLQELSNDVPNFFEALSRQILVFGKVRNRPQSRSVSREPGLKCHIDMKIPYFSCELYKLYNDTQAPQSKKTTKYRSL